MFSRLISLNNEKGTTATYEYMSDGLRLSKTVNGETTEKTKSYAGYSDVTGLAHKNGDLY